MGWAAAWRRTPHDARRRQSYEAEILWDGRKRPLRVLALDGDPLIGTALLKGYNLEVEFEVGGAVTLEARP